MDKNVDWEAFAKDQDKLAKQKEKAKRDRLKASGVSEGLVTDGNRLRQTFAVPFHCQCLHCNKRIGKGTHVYMNRYRAQGEGEGRSSLGLAVWEIQFRCVNCSKHVYIRTDEETPEETGGYIAHKHCKRFVGDFAELNRKQVAKAKEDAAEAAKLLATMSDAERRGIENKARQEADRRLEELMRRRSETTTEDLLARISAGEAASCKNNSSANDVSALLDTVSSYGGDLPPLSVVLDAFAAGGDDGGYDSFGEGDDEEGSDFDSIAFGSGDDERSDSDAEGGDESSAPAVVASSTSPVGAESGSQPASSVGQKRPREEGTDTTETVAVGGDAPAPAPSMGFGGFADESAGENSFLASMAALTGLNLTAPPPRAGAPATTAPTAPTSNTNAVAPTSAASGSAPDALMSGLLTSSAAAKAPAKKKAAKVSGADFLSNYFS